MGIRLIQKLIAAGYVGGVTLLVAWAHGYHGPEEPAPPGGLDFARHFICYGLFHGYEAGRPECPYPAHLEVSLLQPGDIILGHNPHAVYGHWSHATIYLGAHEVLMQNITQGIARGPAAGVDYYDELLVLRPEVPASKRLGAAAWAMRTTGGVFNLVAHPRDLSQWTCAKSVWAAYDQQGVTVADGRFWITPDALAGCPARVVEHRFGSGR
jgi:hypothetical protein